MTASSAMPTARLKAIVRASYGNARCEHDARRRDNQWSVIAANDYGDPVVLSRGMTVRESWQKAARRPMTWAALYMPMREPGEPDPSRYDFATKEEACDYVYEGMCDTCQEKRARYLAGETDWRIADDYPACACEWIVGKTINFDRAGSFDEVMTAGGYKTVYRRPEDEGEASQ